MDRLSSPFEEFGSGKGSRWKPTAEDLPPIGFEPTPVRLLPLAKPGLIVGFMEVNSRKVRLASTCNRPIGLSHFRKNLHDAEPVKVAVGKGKDQSGPTRTHPDRLHPMHDTGKWPEGTSALGIVDLGDPSIRFRSGKFSQILNLQAHLRVLAHDRPDPTTPVSSKTPSERFMPPDDMQERTFEQAQVKPLTDFESTADEVPGTVVRPDRARRRFRHQFPGNRSRENDQRGILKSLLSLHAGTDFPGGTSGFG